MCVCTSVCVLRNMFLKRDLFNCHSIDSVHTGGRATVFMLLVKQMWGLKSMGGWCLLGKEEKGGVE